MTPLAIDLFCGLGGWSEGLLAEGWRVIGFDLERHEYGEHRYPAQLVLQDVLTLHGSQFKDAALIVASPPCQGYSYRAMPWSKAKALPPPDNSLFEACFRIQREACEAAGRHIPLIVENVRGAQKWVGRSRWNYGSFHLWGDVPALMPMTSQRRMKSAISCAPRLWSGRVANTPEEAHSLHYRLPHQKGIPHRPPGHWTNPEENGTKLGGSWFHDYRQGQGPRNHGSKSKARKAASAMIARIPFPLACYIAQVFHPARQS